MFYVSLSAGEIHINLAVTTRIQFKWLNIFGFLVPASNGILILNGKSNFNNLTSSTSGSLPITITKRDNIPYLFREGKNPITYPRTENLTDYNLTLVRSLTKTQDEKKQIIIFSRFNLTFLFLCIPLLEFLPLSNSFSLHY